MLRSKECGLIIIIIIIIIIIMQTIKEAYFVEISLPNSQQPLQHHRTAAPEALRPKDKENESGLHSTISITHKWYNPK
jgi:uncharacterized protein YpmB